MDRLDLVSPLSHVHFDHLASRLLVESQSAGSFTLISFAILPSSLHGGGLSWAQTRAA